MHDAHEMGENNCAMDTVRVSIEEIEITRRKQDDRKEDHKWNEEIEERREKEKWKWNEVRRWPQASGS